MRPRAGWIPFAVRTEAGPPRLTPVAPRPAEVTLGAGLVAAALPLPLEAALLGGAKRLSPPAARAPGLVALVPVGAEDPAVVALPPLSPCLVAVATLAVLREPSCTSWEASVWPLITFAAHWMLEAPA